MRKTSKNKTKPRCKRFVVEVTLGPLETEIVTGMFHPGAWYLIDESGGWVVSAAAIHDAEVMTAADERALDRVAENTMDVWEEMHPGRRWAFHVSTVVRDRQTGELRRKP